MTLKGPLKSGRINKIILLVAVLKIIWVSTNYTYAFTYNLTQLTNNNYYDTHAQISTTGAVVWAGKDGQDYEIFLYKDTNQEIVQLTNNLLDDAYPKINSSGYVVWHGKDDMDKYEIFLFDGNNVTQLTNNDYDDQSPQINDTGYVVWQGRKDNRDYEIFFFDKEKIIQLTDNDYNDQAPQINCNGYIVWQGMGVDGGVFLYNGATIKQFKCSAYSNLLPKINNIGHLAWQCVAENSKEIFFYNGQNIRQITSNSYNDEYPQINDNGLIVWQGYVEEKNTEIFLYDGQTIQLTNNKYYDQYPQINNEGHVVWQGKTGVTDNYTEIFIYKHYEQFLNKLTVNLSGDYYPKINNLGHVVWQGDVNGTSEIFLAIEPFVDIIVSAFLVKFGKVEIGKNLDKEILLTNTGTLTASINDIFITGEVADQFEAASECNWLALDANCHISINFSPTSSGTKEATLVITSNDPDKPTVSIALIGVGAEEENNFPDDYIDGNSTADEGNINNENHTPDNSSSENNNNPGNDGCFITSIAKN